MRRRTLPLLATTISLALLLVVGGVAASKQRHEQSTSSSQSATATKSAGDVSIQSTTVKASFASGTESADFFGVKVSDHGNLLSFESPAGHEAVFPGREGYALCSQSGGLVRGYDTGTAEEGFGPPKFKQPNPGKFPLSITRNTTDGDFQLKQVWAKPDATEKTVTVTMTVKNISNGSDFFVVLSRSGDFDVGSSALDQGARTSDSVWQWDDVSSPVQEPLPGGTMLTALTWGIPHNTFIEQSSAWAVAGGTREECLTASGLPTPTSVQDLAMRVIYLFPGLLSSGQSRTLKFQYGRM